MLHDSRAIFYAKVKGEMIMAEIKTLFRKVKLFSLPEKKDGKNGAFYVFLVADEEHKYKIMCFDDERAKNPFKKLDNALDKGHLTRGTYLSLECELCRYPANAISDERWSQISSDPNPTKVFLDNFKLEDWDYAVPYEIHQKIKELREHKETASPTTLLPIGAEGGSIL